MQALVNHGTLAVAPPDAPPADLVQLMIDAGVQFASATPSYWRRLLMSVRHDQLAQVPLRQITLGGEVVDQPILDRLAGIYPNARIAHIYATTEMGRCFSVVDGQAGFPAALLRQPTADGVQLKLVDGQLWVRSTNAMDGYDRAAEDTDCRGEHDGWFPTRDLVELRGERVYFVGRDSDMINVGGNKVYPVTVERVVRQLEEVADCRISAVASSVAGQLVACQVVPAAGHAANTVRQKVLAHCQQHLDRFQCPRIVQMVTQLELTDAGKLSRSPGPV
jgi:acyl-CoA synthetase (AMP-forming)/AMP-acid ligase II